MKPTCGSGSCRPIDLLRQRVLSWVFSRSSCCSKTPKPPAACQLSHLWPLAAVIIALLLSGCSQQPLHRDTRVSMGTFVEVVSPDERAQKIAFDEIKRIEDLLSKYRPDSEISRLNRAGKLKVSAETFALLKTCKEFSAASDGAFDVSVGALVDLWGFTDKKYRVPSEQEIAVALAKVGADKIILNESDSTVEFSSPGLKVDLGGVAKGYALDRAIEKIKQAGINSCLINAGGQVYCLGDNRGRPWKVAIKDPRGRGVIGLLELKDRAVATSGDYEQFFMAQNQRYAHILDPRTGYPAQKAVEAVTISADSGLTADVLATAVCVLGEEKANELVKKYPGTRIVSLISGRGRSRPSPTSESGV